MTGMQKRISKRSAVAKPPRKTLVGVAGKGLSLGHSVEPMMTTFPEIKLLLHRFCTFVSHQNLIITTPPPN